ncbi:hypothetical protein JCM3766R1_004221 [Sporobolomyces carnicolor]
MNPQQLTTPPPSSTSPHSSTSNSPSSRLHVLTRSSPSASSSVSSRHRPRPRQQACERDEGAPSKRARASVSPPSASRGNCVSEDRTTDDVHHFPTPALTPEQLVSETSDALAATTLVQKQEQASQQRQQQQQQVLESLQAEKDRFVNGLVGASVLAIESIWGPSSPAPVSSSSATDASAASSAATRFSTCSSILPLDYFVREVLRRSRTSCSTLQLALYYLHKSRQPIRDAVRVAKESKDEVHRLAKERSSHATDACRAGSVRAPCDAYPSPPAEELASASSEEEEEESESLSDRLVRLLAAQKSPLLCGRRMFLAALISASKYLQDRNYSNKAWSKISGLETVEINRNERCFLELVGWELHLKAEDFRRWTERLNTLTAAPSSSPGSLAAATAAVDPTLGRQGLARSSSEYLPSPPASTTGIVSEERGQPVDHPTATHVARSKLALVRGHSAGELEQRSSSSSTTLPIARPIRSVPVPSAVVVSSSLSSEERKFKALPVRRHAAGVPATWCTGSSTITGAEGRRGAEELIPVH